MPVKKILSYFLITVLLLLTLSACANKYNIILNFEVDGKIYHTANVKEGIKIAFPADPKKEGYDFGGWFYDKYNYEKPFPKDTILDKSAQNNITVYALWTTSQTSGLKYALKDDNTYKILNYEGNASDIYIPEKYEGKEITSIESAAFSGCVNMRKISIPDSVTEIGDYAFYNCRNLTGIIIPESVKRIGASAFSNCISLSSIEIPESVEIMGAYAFSGSIGLANIVINAKLQRLEPFTFFSCANLINITIPSAVTEIGNHCFYNCTNLSILKLPPSINSIGKNAFGNVKGIVKFDEDSRIKIIENEAFAYYKGISLIIPDSVIEIGENAFYECSNLESVIVSETNAVFKSIDNVLYNKNAESLLLYPIKKAGAEFTVPMFVKNIGKNAFGNCTNLSKIVLHNEIISIGEKAFYNVGGMVNFSSGSTIKTINSYAFAYYQGENITLPKSIVNIGENAFYGVSGNIIFEEGSQITVIGKSAFANYKGNNLILPSGITKIDSYAFSDSALENMVIPSLVNVISPYAFYNCTRLMEIYLPENLTTIDSFAFYNCFSLNAFTIPKNVINIGSYAFSNVNTVVTFAEDTGITNIGNASFAYYKGKNFQIPQSAISIGNSAFYGCSELENISIPDGLQSINSYVFYNCSNLKNIGIPSSVTAIGSYAFGFVNCPVVFAAESALASIGGGVFAYYKGNTLAIPENVTSIGEKAFYNVNATIVFTGNSVKSLSGYCYENYLGENIQIPDSVISIADRAFYNCVNLKNISVSQLNTNYKSSDGVLYNKNGNILLQYPISREDKIFQIPQFVSSIGASAFSNALNLENITIPLGVTDIGASAFSGCVNLKSLILPENAINIGNFAFSEIVCMVDMSNCRITSIGSNTFNGYKGIGLTIPSTVNSIGENAFYNCPNLTEILVAEENADFASINGALYTSDISVLLQYPAGKSEGIFILPSQVELIAEKALYNCQNITAIEAEQGNLKYQSDNGALFCDNFRTLLLYPSGKKDAHYYMPSFVEKIESYAFRNCDNLIAVHFSENNMLKEIGSFAFYGCSNLAKADLPNSVSDIGYWAFEGCYRLEYEIYGNLKYLGNWVMGVSDTSINTVDFRPSTIGIGAYAFKYCGEITEIRIPESVKYIGYAAFEYCLNLNALTIPESMKEISPYAFHGCVNISEITINAEIPPQIGNGAFRNSAELKIYVLGSSLDLYKSIWTAYADKIYPQD